MKKIKDATLTESMQLKLQEMHDYKTQIAMASFKREPYYLTYMRRLKELQNESAGNTTR